jgi:hypothetical protein
VKVLQKTIPYQLGQRFKFVCFSDVHHGNALSSTRLFQQELINRHKDDPDTFFLDMGDGMDLIVAQAGDKRFKASMVDPRYLAIDNPVDAMIEGYAALLEPIKDRLLVMLTGNHSLSILDRYGTDPTRRVAYLLWGKEAENRILGYAGFLVTRFNWHKKAGRVRSLTWNLTHGISTGGKTLGGYITSMGTDSSYYCADIHCFGHNHRLAGVDRIKIGVDHHGRKIISKKEIILNTGTFLKGLSETADVSYAERARYVPGELGYMEMNVRMQKNGEELYHSKRTFL